MKYSVLNVTSKSHLLLIRLRDQCRKGGRKIEKAKEGVSFRHSSEDACMNSQNMRQQSQDLQKLKLDKIPTWRSEVAKKL